MCDKKGPTISLIKATTGRTFGGFTSQEWDGGSGYKKDPHAYLFSVDNQAIFYVTQNNDKAIFCNYGYGITFGDGHELFVETDSNQPGANSFTR